MKKIFVMLVVLMVAVGMKQPVIAKVVKTQPIHIIEPTRPCDTGAYPYCFGNDKTAPKR